MKGEVSKQQFLHELTLRTPSHQLCFCTVQSLQALNLSKHKFDGKVMNIDNEIVKALMTDYGKTETEAIDMHYTSATCTQLADETTGFYLKPWSEIYDMLKKELKI